MRKYQPSMKALNLIRVLLFVAAALFCLAAVWAGIRFSLPIIMYIALPVFALLYIFVSFIYLPIYFKNSVFLISPDEVSKQSGVFFTSHQFMKFSSVQYFTEIRFPLSRLTSCNFIILHALGGTVVLTFLSRHDFEELSAALAHEIRKRAERSGGIDSGKGR